MPQRGPRPLRRRARGPAPDAGACMRRPSPRIGTGPDGLGGLEVSSQLCEGNPVHGRRHLHGDRPQAPLLPGTLNTRTLNAENQQKRRRGTQLPRSFPASQDPRARIESLAFSNQGNGDDCKPATQQQQTSRFRSRNYDFECRTCKAVKPAEGEIAVIH